MSQQALGTSGRCSSVEAASILNEMLTKLYVPDDNGDYRCSTKDEAVSVLLETQKYMHNFVKELVHKYEDEFDALAALAEVDHRLNIPDEDFTIDYDTENFGGNDAPYTIKLQYGDPSLGYVRIAMSATST